MTYYCTLESPIGPLLLRSNGAAVTGIFMDDHKGGPLVNPGWVQDPSLECLALATAQLKDYFEGTLREFDLPLEPTGSEFQLRVWQELQRIPYGVTISYGELARRLGDPKASRAVGLANGRNPISIVVPCHRVIGANGKLVGYGGGLPRKQFLLAHEQLFADLGQPELFAAR